MAESTQRRTRPATARLVRRFAIGRVIIGAVAVVLPGQFSRLLGYPAAHDNATARVMGRLFGIRDIALGVQVWHAAENPTRVAELASHNAMVDAGDAAILVGAIVTRKGIPRGAISSLAPAVAGCVAWILLSRRIAQADALGGPDLS